MNSVVIRQAVELNGEEVQTQCALISTVRVHLLRSYQ